MKRRVVFFVLAASLVASCNLTYAQEQVGDSGQKSPGHRSGFIIGFGLGPGYTHVSQSFDLGYDDVSGSIDKFAINTDFKIGFAANRQTLIYWNSKVAWFADEIGILYYDYYSGDYYVQYEDATFASGIGGLGVSYYFKTSLPSPYVTATIGYSSFGTPFNDNYDGETGFGMAAGFGYEFAPHWSIEGDLSYGKSSNDPLSTNVVSFKALINVLSF